MSSELLLGPLSFTHHVQRIMLNEQKGVEVVKTSRSDRNFIIDNVEGFHSAQIHFLFTGINELNSELRKLIALFRICPIISIRNEFLTTSWKKPDSVKILDSQSSGINKDLIPKKVVYSDFIPIALCDLTIQTVPDIPFACNVILTIARIDTDSFSPEGLKYQTDQLTSGSIDPRRAYWLTKWLNKVVSDTNLIDTINESDFESITISPYLKTLAGADITINTVSGIEAPSSILNLNRKTTRTLSESCRISNNFAFHKLIGKGFPTAQHMGMTSRISSLDILFDTSSSDSGFSEFCKFKEASDEAIRNINRYDRATGWELKSPISKLLGTNQHPANSMRSRFGVFVPLSVEIETTETPNIKIAKIDFAESDVEHVTNQDTLLVEGGTDYQLLKKFFMHVVAPYEQKFRDRLSADREELARALAGQTNFDISAEAEMFKLFWPTDRVTEIRTGSKEGIMNADSLRATFLNPRFDRDTRLMSALKDLDLVVGAGTVGPTQPPLLTRLDVNISQLQQIQDGPYINSVTAQKVIQIINEYFRRISSDTIGTDADIYELTLLLYEGYTGDRGSNIIPLIGRSSTGKLLEKLFKNNVRFSNDFLESLFDTIVKRNRPPSIASRLYSGDGLDIAFVRLSLEYISYLRKNPHPFFENLDIGSSDEHEDVILDRIAKNTTRVKRTSVYQDMILPSYADLYEERWEEFAPTYSDLGILNWKGTNNITLDELTNAQEFPAVLGNDIVEPHVWFFRERAKPELLAAVKTGAKLANSVSHDLALSLPFNTQEITDLEKILKKRAESDKTNSTKSDTLSSIIKNALIRHQKSNPQAFKQDMQALRKAAYSQYKNKYLGNTSNKIRVYWTYADNFHVPHKLTVAGLGGEIYRVADELKYLERSEYGPLDIDSEYKAVGDATESSFIRHLDDNTEKMVKSIIDQVPDDKFTGARLFPAAKVYLIDKRGNDIIVDDTFFSVNAIVSIDITLDKDDADLAVIKIADPMYILQNSTFSAGSVVKAGRFDEPAEKDYIRDTIIGKVDQDLNGYLNRFKIRQGRHIQIRMGYTSMAGNLPIVFTGRITEINPGDVITIVAQGWKVELINNQVSFYNDDPVNFSAKDLAVMTVQHANPEGFGDYFAQYNTDLYLQHLNNLDSQDIIERSAIVMEDTTTTKGSRGIVGGLVNSIITTLGFRSLQQDDKGLDTRLKNIWYPDSLKYNNILGTTTKLTNPLYANNGWIIPIQPAWDVLKEASRHAWNCIVQVVPYDSEATLFFGHPDQPYFYTRGDATSKAIWRKYRNKLARNQQVDLKILYDNFLGSEHFGGNQTVDEAFIRQRIIQYNVEPNRDKFNVPTQIKFLIHDIFGLSAITGQIKPSFLLFKSLLQDPIINTIFSRLQDPYIAYVKFQELLGLEAPYVLLKIFFGLDKGNLNILWPDIHQSFNSLMSASTNSIDARNEEIFHRTSGLSADLAYDVTARFGDQIEDLRRYFIRADGSWNRPLTAIRENLRSLGQINDSSIRDIVIEILQFIDTAYKEAGQYPDTVVSGREPFGTIIIAKRTAALQKLTEFYNRLAAEVNRAEIPGISYSNKVQSLGELLQNNLQLFRAFVYFFHKYIEDTAQSRSLLEGVKKNQFNILPPNMKAFRVHHWIDSTSDILQNNIVASTSEMWNSVVVEHPAKGEEDNLVDTSADLIKNGNIFSSVKWEYWPKQEITGVIGMQFHPGMTLANKKIQVFNEINCRSPELACRIAHNHLAEGIRRMYRGTLIIKGRHIKPYDRLIIDDKYTQISGPLEVESVIHHWNPTQGWLTNIVPQAVCDANPGSSLIQTAILEASYRKIFNTIDFASDAITIALLIGTLGGGSIALGAGRGIITSGLKNILSGTVLKNLGYSAGSVASSFIQGKLNPLTTLGLLWKNAGGLVLAGATNITTAGIADQLTHFSFQLNVIPAFVQNATDVEQLPVLLSPLIYNGMPFTAGLEMDDAIYSIFSNGIYYSLRDLSQMAEKVLNEFLELDKVPTALSTVR